MKKKNFVFFALCFCFVMLIATGVQAKPWSPLKFSLWPGIWSIPSERDIHGINFGFTTFSGEEQNINGLDFGIFLSMTDNVSGVQLSPFMNTGNNGAGASLCSILNYAYDFDGFQTSFLNRTVNSDFLIQFGGANDAHNSKSTFQLGVYNRAINDSHGLQLGFINKMDNGFLPVFPFINFSV